MNTENTGASRRRTLSMRSFRSQESTFAPSHRSGQLGTAELRRLVAAMVD